MPLVLNCLLESSPASGTGKQLADYAPRERRHQIANMPLRVGHYLSESLDKIRNQSVCDLAVRARFVSRSSVAFLAP